MHISQVIWYVPNFFYMHKETINFMSVNTPKQTVRYVPGNNETIVCLLSVPFCKTGLKSTSNVDINIQIEENSMCVVVYSLGSSKRLYR